MPDLTVSSDIDTFMQAADNAAAQAALGVPALANAPVVLRANGVTIGTSGSPVDRGTITVPAWLTRYHLGPTGTSGSQKVINMTGGDLSAGQFVLRTAAAGGGSVMTGAFVACPNAAGVATTFGASGTTVVFTASTIHIHQIQNSVNAGTVDIYLVLYPLV